LLSIFSILTCLVCGKPSYYVKLTFIRKAAVSKDWAEKHFWPNAVEHADRRVAVTLSTDIQELPHSWILSRIKTPKRPLDQHQFGLFRLPDTGGIPDDQTIPLLKAAWPLVTTRFNKRLPQRPSIERFLAAIKSGDIKLVERLIARAPAFTASLGAKPQPRAPSTTAIHKFSKFSSATASIPAAMMTACFPWPYTTKRGAS
jgi:hypothetical protein